MFPSRLSFSVHDLRFRPPQCGPAAQEMDKLAGEKAGANFLLVNVGDVNDAESYQMKMGLSGKCPHGAANSGVPADYKVQYIPHKVLIGKDGIVIKNFEGEFLHNIDM